MPAGLAERPYYTETSRVIVPVNIWLISSAVTDLGISVILVTHLNKMKTGFKHTASTTSHHYISHSYPVRSIFQEKTLSRIVRVSFETAALTSFLAIVDLLVYITTGKENTAHLAFQMVVGKTYNHSVMVPLLARTRIRNEFDSNSAGRLGNSDSGGTRPTGPAVGVTVTRTQIRVTDRVEIPMKALGAEEEEMEMETSSAKIERMV
ncbi:hypothetical protein FB45DRAFT_1029321 [Roridomyces roridus]|uniref:DUF6534 domain-containing protein n=1 Tax=Roridomyces roridus TaxID=1738132 RepID=A0AAD7FJ73_9AGAR|nr:hypothetical protein FB45DRAFT_1029321 [Roridomyces roridus]